MKTSTFLMMALLYGQTVVCQPADSLSMAVRTLLLSPKIADKIFFDYDGEWSGAFQLTSGRYAFIVPDTTFRKINPHILEELPRATATDGLLYKRKFYADSLKSIYVDGSVNRELCVLFREISVRGDIVNILFVTTSKLEQTRFENRYIEVKAKLQYKNAGWKIVDCRMVNKKWYDHLELNKNVRPSRLKN